MHLAGQPDRRACRFIVGPMRLLDRTGKPGMTLRNTRIECVCAEKARPPDRSSATRGMRGALVR
eukprot:11567122-Alexandrium_andersonii.AAC.1